MSAFNKNLIVKKVNGVLSKESKNHISFLLISVVTILVFIALSGCFPYSGDDWAWGSNIGLVRLGKLFDNYNGRYLGNLLILAISRSKVLSVSAMAISYYAVCWLCYRYSGINKNVVFVFSVMLFFMMPQTVFMQSVVWTSGFSNYVPSAILSLIYILLIRNVTEKNPPCYPKFLFIATFILGVCGALFIENVTIFNVCLGLAVIVYAAVKFKKVYSPHISFFVGAVTGFLLMFSNSAYVSISDGTDNYRDVPLDISGLVLRCANNGYKIFDHVINSNYMLCIVVSFLLLLLTITTVRKPDTKRKKLITGAMLLNVFSLLSIIYFKNTFDISREEAFENIPILMSEIILAVVYVFSLFCIIQMCIPSKEKLNVLLPLLCIPVMVAPLIIVSPLGPRCFFASYFFMMVFTVNLFGYIIKDADFKMPSCKILSTVVSIVAVVQIVLSLVFFIPIHKYDVKRNEFAKQQSDDGKNQIVVSSLPNEEYLWMGSPIEEPWITRYKRFYGLNEDAEIKVVSPEEFDEYYAMYNND